MRIFKRFQLVALLIVCFTFNSKAQELTVNLMDLGIGSYQSLLINDFDFLLVGSAQELFSIQLTKTQGVIEVENISIRLFQGNELLASILTNNFSLTSEPMSWVFSNKELADGNVILNDGPKGQVRIVSSELDPGANELQSEILATSSIPVGEYSLRAKVTYSIEGDMEQRTAEGINIIRIVISNPFLINLVFPGTEYNSGILFDVFTEQPILQWNGNSGRYQVLVFQKRNEFSTTDEILNSVPVWQSTILEDGLTSTQYPDFGAVPLVYGQSYAWLVRAVISTSSGDQFVNSELWEFTLVDPSQMSASALSMAKQQLITVLKQLIGDKADALIQQLDGYDLTTIRLNNNIVEIQDLYPILEKYRNTQVDVTDLSLDSSN